ncbi:hypothetical protein [Heyndrickxia ginsengihumi]|uniref:DUF4190 domain-containing protein n=1 Tax=Heyndrickxia ginsengihumi TaxID=363870 RepID=A0A0A6V9K3_9BACI|nr:hypothetical protein [Heyndrickxia ginsengihumi]KHD84830.1 hypothetical protein NG54_12850 [Heyndrickxia ginsengihumi]MBE6183785.1 hypothetical protein [Bacillus sp. (in: firmicutes)]MCM3021743.1 hypothetical protein [Heyndrickxia ginsengihumi]NEY19676.1 hypothetical protein [Heyndrickxia ginsengihumi]
MDDDKRVYPLNQEDHDAVDDVDHQHRDYEEETAAEIASPVVTPLPVRRDDVREEEDDDDAVSHIYGWAALAVAILSLFFMPVILGVAAIVLGFIARKKDAATLGIWSICIGAISLIIGLFFTPFF